MMSKLALTEVRNKVRLYSDIAQVFEDIWLGYP
jgi:hypothetical protein